MKSNRNGQAEILTTDELSKLFSEGLLTQRDRALFAICLFTGCRISEALALNRSDIKGGVIVLRKETTKGRLATREIDVEPGLQRYLDEYTAQPQTGSDALFPGKRGMSERLTLRAADFILRAACERVGLVGVSTHSFRRTALTMMSNANTPLAHIQKVSGHHDLGSLQRYLEVTKEQRKSALSAIKF